MLYAIVAVIALILDQAVKYWTTVNIVADTGVKEFIPGFLRLTNVHNTGAAFSFLEGARWFFVILCILFVALVIAALVKNWINTPVARWMAVIVMAGAIGNCIDRVVCGYVVDMFEFDFLIFGRHFPVFNVADIYITVGAVLFALCVLLEKDGAARAKKAEAAAIQTPSGKTVPARKHEASPRRRSFKKTQIPDFPSHAPMAQPAVDPNDPFAEWERRAAAKAAPAPTPAPAPAEVPVEAPAEAPVETPAPEIRPAEPQPAPAPAAPSPKAQADAAAISGAADELSFDLDDILAEFKDL
ncbi:MAG: signal peptidase II [Oscillospiraceae bacterium]